MNNNYFLLHIMFNGAHCNTYIDSTISDFVIKHLGKDIVVINSLEITRFEYEEYKAKKIDTISQQ